MYQEQTSLVIAYYFLTADERKQFVVSQRKKGIEPVSQATIFQRHLPESKRFKVVYSKQDIKKAHVR